MTGRGMKAYSHNSAFPLVTLPRTCRKHRFTLVEIMIVVGIIGLLALLTLPSFIHARKTAQNNRFMSDLRTAAGQFEQYAIMEGGWPRDKNPAQIPNGMADYLDRFPWTENTSIGGQWDWDYGVFSVTAGVSVYMPDRTESEMAPIDEKMDNGDTRSGLFRYRSQGYIYVLEP